uniref:KH domain-containing protein n=1 Tax=Gongylonema pulchrum TaxID=637853 RepID=A0A183EVF3_9BILA
LASSLSPADDVPPSASVEEMQPVYEFEIPNTLVGLIIGIKGKTIKIPTHQICTVRGPRENINRCLRMMRHRFPTNRFPELNLRPVLPSPFPEPSPTTYPTKPVQVLLAYFLHQKAKNHTIDV